MRFGDFILIASGGVAVSLIHHLSGRTEIEVTVALVAYLAGVALGASVS